jgi:hypothetical protein
MLTAGQVLHLVVGILERSGIEYMIGGSVAGSIHGIPRMTQDADVVVDLRPGHAALLAAAFAIDFYVDQDAISEAVRNRGSFNIIHLESMFKVDFFVLSQRPFDRESFRNRRTVPDPGTPHGLLFVCGPEELVVTKLEWYDKGGRVSDRQYRDVLGILRVQSEAGTLDGARLDRLAAELQLSELLAQARADAGLQQ